MTSMLLSPLNGDPDWNAICFPSGDQAGALLSDPLVKARGSEPSTLTTQTWPTPSLEVRVNAICWSSGDQAGWLSLDPDGGNVSWVGRSPCSPITHKPLPALGLPPIEYAIRVPSADHAGSPSTRPSVVSRVTFEPSGFIE